MAHFAKLTENNIVSSVLYVSDNDIKDENGVEQESLGKAHLQKHNAWPAHLWIQTSYRTKNNQHDTGGTPFRGNYAGIGYTWDVENEIFWPLQPYASWTKNLTTASWISPVNKPDLTQEQLDQITADTHAWEYRWNEPALSWDLVNLKN